MKIKLDKLDVLFSQFIRLRANNHCEKCGAYKEIKQLQTSHFFGRRRRSVRWNEDNAAGLCFSCHQYFTENPLEHTEWFKARLGEDKFLLLLIQSNIPQKVDRKAIELYLKEKIKDLHGG